MPKTYKKIGTETLPSANNSITFSNIPGSYTDLVIVGHQTAATNCEIGIRFNGDSGSNYDQNFVSGVSPFSVIKGSHGTNNQIYLIWTQGTLPASWTGTIINIFNYANTTTYKTMLSRLGGKNESNNNSGTWKSTAPITSVTVFGSSNFSTGSTWTLYGIKAA